MTGPAVIVSSQSLATKAAAMSRGRLPLVLGLAFVLACRLVLYFHSPDRATDFDPLYHAAIRLLRGETLYPEGAAGLPYPLPAVLLGVPFAYLPLGLARPVFDVLVGWTFVYALWRYRGPYALLALLSGAYVFALLSGQTTPLIVAASMVPALGFLLAVRPTTAVPLWCMRPSWAALLGSAGFLILSLAIQPLWPFDWWMAVPTDLAALRPPILRPLGFLLLLAAFRWRWREGRLLLATAFLPQTTLPYELVPLALIATSAGEMAVFVLGSWLVVYAAHRLHLGQGMMEWTYAGWTVTLAAVYIPMLYVVLRRQISIKKIFWKERRRAHRLPDEDLKVEVRANDDGEYTATVTHLPTGLFTSETNPVRDTALRRAHDKLASLMSRTSRLKKSA
jgi:hypothetical protein